MNYIDLKKSFIYLNPNEENTWRTNIKSILEDHSSNTKYFLTKECRAELIGKYPFDHTAKSELCVVLNDKKFRVNIRDMPINKKKDFHSHFYETKLSDDDICLQSIDYKKIEFKEIINSLNNRKLADLYVKFSYEFERKTYTIFTQVEYLNFKGKKKSSYEATQENYLQPICGYVPFIMNENIYISYVVKYIGNIFEGNLEFILRKNISAKYFSTPETSFIKNVLRKLSLFIMSPIKISEFSSKISIKDSKMEFYQISI